jgi:hypothetical protein
MVKLMGPNTGKLADIVVLEGNPLEGYWNFLNARVVIKGGAVVVELHCWLPFHRIARN